MSHSRWILFTGGTLMGPAVLLWGGLFGLYYPFCLLDIGSPPHTWWAI